MSQSCNALTHVLANVLKRKVRSTASPSLARVHLPPDIFRTLESSGPSASGSTEAANFGVDGEILVDDMVRVKLFWVSNGSGKQAPNDRLTPRTRMFNI